MTSGEADDVRSSNEVRMRAYHRDLERETKEEKRPEHEDWSVEENGKRMRGDDWMQDTAQSFFT